MLAPFTQHGGLNQKSSPLGIPIPEKDNML